MLGKKKSTKELVGAGNVTLEENPAPTEKRKKESSERKEKNPRRPVKDIIRSRGFAAAVCITAGLLVAFVISPLLQARASKTTQVLVLSQDAAVGVKLTANMLVVQERGLVNLPSDVLRNMADAEGKYVAIAGRAGDILTAGRVADELISDDPELTSLPEGKLAMSAALISLEQSVSGKLRAGDVIQIFAAEEDRQGGTGKFEGRAVEELQRVLVVSVTNSTAQDIIVGDETPDVDRKIATVVLAVNVEQATVLAGLDRSAVLYAALVTRGSPADADAALQQQEDYFAQRPIYPSIPEEETESEVVLPDEIDTGEAGE